MTHNQRIIIPNSDQGFVADAVRRQLAMGNRVTMRFGGNSMMPTIDDRRDSVELEPINAPLRRGDVCLFAHDGHLVVHRLVRHRGDRFFFRGDNNRACEAVGREAVMARLSAIVHDDGSRTECHSPRFRRRGRCLMFRADAVCVLARLFGQGQRRWERWAYFALLLILMWSPVGALGVPLNNFVLGIRADHLVHASVYIPAALFFVDFYPRSRHRLRRSWLSALLLGVTTETVQYFLPYRGFDINDMVANAIGVSLGALLLLPALRKVRGKK